MKKEEKIQIRIQKEFKEELKEHAENQNEPMSIYILKSVRERINKENFENAVALRNELHKNAEVGFKMDKTLAIIEAELDRLDIKHEHCSKSGICAVIGKGDKCFLLRADMDALPIREESGVSFACDSGNYSDN